MLTLAILLFFAMPARAGGGGDAASAPADAPAQAAVPPSQATTAAPEAGKAPHADPNKPFTSGPPPGGFPMADSGNGQGVAPEQGGETPAKPARDEKKIQAADVYYYKDEQGNMKAVEGIDAVPEKFRAKAKPAKKY